MLDWLEKVAAIAGGFGTLLLSVIAMIVGGWWFRKRASLQPRLCLQQEVVRLPGPPRTRVLQVLARIENVGEIPVTLNEWRLWAIPLDPLPPQVIAALRKSKGHTCVEQNLQWESCAGGEMPVDVRVRPGEVQEVVGTMLVSDTPSAVRIFSCLPHADINLHRGEDRVWTCYTLVRFNDRPDPSSPPIERPKPWAPEHRDEPYRRPGPQKPGADEPYRRPVEPPPDPPQPNGDDVPQ